jgi:hypothetical protein
MRSVIYYLSEAVKKPAEEPKPSTYEKMKGWVGDKYNTVKDHLGRNWKKYALGAAAVGAGLLGAKAYAGRKEADESSNPNVTSTASLNKADVAPKVAPSATPPKTAVPNMTSTASLNKADAAPKLSPEIQRVRQAEEAKRFKYLGVKNKAEEDALARDIM